MKYTVPRDIQMVLDLLRKGHEEAFLVGGCVRDMFLHRPIHDYDITTSMLAENVVELFQKENYIVIPTGIKYGTVTVIANQYPVEITTYRTELSYQNHRTPTHFVYTKHLEDDLKRRDFTINAIAYHPKLGYQDPYQGLKDIKEHCIRCVENADQRFQEDALRILRALRFACTLSFHIEHDTAKAIQKYAYLLQHISRERVRDEFTKMLLTKQRYLLTFLKDYNVLYYILPDMHTLYHNTELFSYHFQDKFRLTDEILNHAQQEPLTTKLALILHPYCTLLKYHSDNLSLNCVCKDILKKMKYDKKTILDVFTLIQFYHYPIPPQKNALRRFLYELDHNIDIAFQILHMRQCILSVHNVPIERKNLNQSISLLKAIIKEKDYIEKNELQINGHDLIQLGYQGKKIGALLQYAYEQTLEMPSLNTKKHLLSIIQNYHDKQS